VLLAEVAEDEAAPAGVVLGVGADHLEARAVEAVALLLRLHCSLDHLRHGLSVPLGRAHAAVGIDLDRTHVLEPRQRAHEARRGEVAFFAQLTGWDGVLARTHDAHDALDRLAFELAAGEEAA
jgi:hypothetical protein